MAEGFMERIGRAQEDPEKPEDSRSDLTLSAILADQRHGERFGKFLEQVLPTTSRELIRMLNAGELDSTDMDSLEMSRRDYAERILNAEKITGQVTPDMARRMARNNAHMRAVVHAIGPERSAQFVRDQLLDVAVTDEASFVSVRDAVHELESYRTTTKEDVEKYEKETRELLEKYGISESKYEGAARMSDEIDRRKELKKLAEENMNGIAWLLGAGHVASERLEGKREEAELHAHEINTRIGAIGGALAGVISGNEDVRRAFSEALLKKAPERSGQGVVSIKDAMAVEKGLEDESKTKTEWGKEWKKFKQELENMRVPLGAISDEEKERFQNEFLDRHKRKTKGGKRGFWATMIDFMLDEFKTRHGNDVLTF